MLMRTFSSRFSPRGLILLIALGAPNQLVEPGFRILWGTLGRNCRVSMPDPIDGVQGEGNSLAMGEQPKTQVASLK